MTSDETIKKEMESVLRRKKRICPKTMAADVLVEEIQPKCPGMSIVKLAVAVFRLSGRKPFRRRLDDDDDIVICLRTE